MASFHSHGSGQVPVKCGLCETDRSIQWKCMDCSLLMCDHCKTKVHSKFKNGREHRIIDKNEDKLHMEEIEFTNIKCPEHNGQLLCLYCKTCDKLVCPTCFAKVHKKHDLIEISDAYNIKVERIKIEVMKMQKSIHRMNVKKDHFNKLVFEENSTYSKVRQDILIHETTVKEQVKQYFEELINKLDKSHETVLSSVKDDLNAITSFTNQTEDKINEVQDFIRVSNASDVFKEAKQMEMEKFTKTDEPVTKPNYASTPKFVPGYFTKSSIGALQDGGNLSTEIDISLDMKNEYQTAINGIQLVSPCLDQSIWISSGPFRILQRVQPDGTNLRVMSKFNIEVRGMAVTPSNQLLLCVRGKTRLQQINSSGELIESVYDVSPYYPIAIHFISGNQLIVGAHDDQLKKNAVMILSDNGNIETVYRPLINGPISITSTNYKNIHVVDRILKDYSGKVVVLGQEGHIINEYAGHSTINKHKSFKPVNIVATPYDNVVVIDLNTNILHILSDNGNLVSYCNVEKIGITFPQSLAFNVTGQFYIGRGRIIGSKTKEAKLYEINIEGV
ncbi:Hypothetical predicted protein [Mytilus galloprovincialis]|uniref:B box-type domain-containing protein n=1 Tax=Mytilus galloprovincialis TaxID=29158 RepID=A0A8B6EAA5_MYTGA|nr:Hypothetical predicted protein [Mytilus galloprovincialis]